MSKVSLRVSKSPQIISKSTYDYRKKVLVEIHQIALTQQTTLDELEVVHKPLDHEKINNFIYSTDDPKQFKDLIFSLLQYNGGINNLQKNIIIEHKIAIWTHQLYFG